ncbi:MAG: ABC transporter permease, partial [Planctomycetales bacterium]
ALGQPVLFWMLFGAGLHSSFVLETASDQSVSYQEYFFPGVMVMIVLFTAIFSTISIIEDRKEGVLQSVLVAPVSRSAMVAGKLLGGTLIALAQALLFLGLGWLGGTLGWWSWGFNLGPASLLATVALLFVLGFALCGLGFLLAWKMDSTQGFHAVMTVFLMPMWLLSGAFFPADGWLSWVIRANPLTYGVAALRRTLYWNAASAPLPEGLPSLEIGWIVTLAFAAVTFLLCRRVASERITGDLL